MHFIKHLLILVGMTALAILVGNYFPILGQSTGAIILGMIFANLSFTRRTYHLETMKSLGSDLLKYAIIVLGLTLSLQTITGIGLASLRVSLGVILVAFIVAQIVGKWLNIDADTRTLLGMGTAICGGSAIATASPIIKAKDNAVAMSLTTVFFYNLLALFIFPLLGDWLNYSQLQFEVFAGAAINDTSSVVAAGFAYGELAGAAATVTKLVRTVMIVPTSLYLLFQQIRHSLQSSASTITQKQVLQLIPSFILWFMVTILIATFFPLPATVTSSAKIVSELMMTAALSAVGLTIEWSQFKRAGFRPILLGGIVWAAVTLTAMGLIKIFY